jgi:hypothetical protein
MSIRAHYDEPCWQINDEYGTSYDADLLEGGIRHYRTRAKAAEEIADLVAERHRDFDDYEEPLLLVAALAFPNPCVGIFCDGPCGEPFDCADEGWTHFDPLTAEQDAYISDADWNRTADGKHYCPSCAPALDTDELQERPVVIDGQIEIPFGEGPR